MNACYILRKQQQQMPIYHLQMENKCKFSGADLMQLHSVLGRFGPKPRIQIAKCARNSGRSAVFGVITDCLNESF